MCDLPSLRLLAISLLSILLTISGCAGDSSQSGIPQLSLVELQAAPESVAYSGQSYKLETYLWRDFMPMSPPGGKGLMAVVRIVEVDSNPIGEGTSLDFLWVIHGEEVWATTFSDETRPSGPPFKQEAVARNGPQWEPNVEVDVVVGLRDASGEFRLLRASGQTIHRTD